MRREIRENGTSGVAERQFDNLPEKCRYKFAELFGGIAAN